MQVILSIILAVILSLNLAKGAIVSPSESALPAISGQAAAVEPADPGTLPETEPAIPAAPAYAPQDVDWSDMEYWHYEPDAFYDGVDELAAQADGANEAAVIRLYEELYEEYTVIDTLDAIAYIRYSADVTDEYWSGETLYCGAILAEMNDALCTACHEVMLGPCRDGFSAYVGPDAADVFLSYEPMTEREAELTERELELVNEYYERINDADDATYMYRGETWTFDMIQGFRGRNLAYQDYDSYLEVFYGLQKTVNDAVGPIFTELVSVRTELARLAGYDNYIDYAYELVYGRDYAPEDAQLLCDTVKELAPAYYEELYYSDLWYSTDIPSPVMSGQELVSVLGRYTGLIDPALETSWQYFSDHGLYDLAAGGDRMDGAYTTGLSRYGSGFIFATLDGSCCDFGTLSHEFGHFTNEYLHPAPNVLTSVGQMDLLEIHSQGLEALLTEYYDQIYAQGGDIAAFITLGNMFESILDGCIYDEFQRRIYAEPDMSLDGINRLFAAVCAEYGSYEPLGVDYSWVYVLHNFEAPLYYISYATSALAALQIWALARQDLQAGIDAYMAVLEAGAYEDGYMTVLPSCGMRLFTEPGAVEDICGPLLSHLKILEQRAYAS